MARSELHRLIDGTILRQKFNRCEKAYLSIGEIIKYIDDEPTYERVIVEVETSPDVKINNL